MATPSWQAMITALMRMPSSVTGMLDKRLATRDQMEKGTDTKRLATPIGVKQSIAVELTKLDGRLSASIASLTNDVQDVHQQLSNLTTLSTQLRSDVDKLGISATQTWTMPALLNRWAAYNGHDVLGYRKYLNQLLFKGTIGSGYSGTTTLFTLPSEYWPKVNKFVPVGYIYQTNSLLGSTTNYGVALLNISTAGVVSVTVANTPTCVCLDGTAIPLN